MEHGIVLAPETLNHIGILPVTNTLLVSWVSMAILIAIAIITRFSIRLIPEGFQNFLEIIIDFGWTTVEDLAHEKAKVIFPICFTFFLYIIVSNYLGLLPGVGTIRFNGDPLLRSMNSDLNSTLGLALVSAVATHVLALRYLGLKDYLKRWFTLNPIFLFVGILELVGEFTKVISLSFRLFGNIFAGEIVISTISNMFAFLLPLPFYFLEIIVGFVQAAIFMMLTLVFMVILTEKHEAH